MTGTIEELIASGNRVIQIKLYPDGFHQKAYVKDNNRNNYSFIVLKGYDTDMVKKLLNERRNGICQI